MKYTLTKQFVRADIVIRIARETLNSDVADPTRRSIIQIASSLSITLSPCVWRDCLDLKDASLETDGSGGVQETYGFQNSRTGNK